MATKGKLRESTKNYIYALIINPVTTMIIIAMMQANMSIFNLIGAGIIGYGCFAYFLIKGIRLDYQAYKAKKNRGRKGRGGKKKKGRR